MREIVLNASLGNYSLFASRKRNKKFRELARKIWHRDDYTCQFCGFQAKEYQEVINFDQNYRRNTPSNMGTSCCFCTQCFFLESAGEGGYGGGTIIYLPEISQNELNSMCHVLFCAMVNETEYKESAQSIYRSLRMRSQAVEEKLGEGVSDPAVLGQLLVDYRASHKNDETEQLLQPLRLLASRGRFQKQVETWAESALSGMDEADTTE